jgi:general secretion pathway protein I
MNRSQGFTLIEVMIALVVFAVVSVALVKNASTSLRQTAVIENRITAWWLAENEMTALRTQPRNEQDYPSVGVSRQDVELGESSWEVETTIESTENDYVRRVLVNVYKNSSDESSAELIGFIGRY